MKTWFCVFYLLLCSWVQGQNLVKNPGFEKYYYLQDLLNEYGERYVDSAFICRENDWLFFDRCMNRVWAIDTVLICRDWYRAQEPSFPDYFRVNAKNRFYGIPHNHIGDYPALADSAYMGVLPLALSGETNPLSGEFTAPLEKGKRYKVSFSCCFAYNTSHFYLDKIEAFISTDNWITQDTRRQNTYFSLYERLIKDTIVANVTFETPLVNDGKWHRIIGYYQAKGGEKYISFGIFYQNKKFTKIMNKYRRDRFPPPNHQWIEKFFQKYQSDLFIHPTPRYNSSTPGGYYGNKEFPPYYFIDDVSVTEIY